MPIVTNHGVPVGRLVQDVIAVTLVNNTLFVHDYTVASGKRIKLMGLRVTNPDDVARDVQVRLYKEAGKTNYLRRLFVMSVPAAPGGAIQWPYLEAGDETTLDSRKLMEYILDEGNTIEFQWAAGGASAGGTDADGLVLIFMEIDI